MFTGTPTGTAVRAGFMDRAIILSVHLQQGSSNANTATIVGWLRAKTGDGAYDYKWQFGG
jgi:hypothetical protein